jgi:hypothetical protein
MENKTLSMLKEKQLTQKKKWYEDEKKYEFVLPVSLDVARERIDKAFSSEITISKNFFAPTLNYAGYMKDLNLYISFRSSPRGSVHYIFGRLEGNSDQCHLKFAIRNKSFLPFFVVPAVAIFRLNSIFEGIVVGIFFGLLSHIALNLQRAYAASNVTSLLKNIITCCPLD